MQVCDFGLSRARRSTMLSTKSQAGTPEWTAPGERDCLRRVFWSARRVDGIHLVHGAWFKCRARLPRRLLLVRGLVLPVTWERDVAVCLADVDQHEAASCKLRACAPRGLPHQFADVRPNVATSHNRPWLPLTTCAAEVLRSQPYNEKCDVYSYGEQQRMPMPEWLRDRQQSSKRKVDRRQQQRMLKANSSTFRAAHHRLVAGWSGAPRSRRHAGRSAAAAPCPLLRSRCPPQSLQWRVAACGRHAAHPDPALCRRDSLGADGQ